MQCVFSHLPPGATHFAKVSHRAGRAQLQRNFMLFIARGGSGLADSCLMPARSCKNLHAGPQGGWARVTGARRVTGGTALAELWSA